jgi:hypothetical protein
MITLQRNENRDGIADVSMLTLWSQIRNLRAAERRRGRPASKGIEIEYRLNGSDTLIGHAVKGKHSFEVDPHDADSTRQVPTGITASVKGGSVQFDMTGRAEITREGGHTDVYQILEPLTEDQRIAELAFRVLDGEGPEVLAQLDNDQLGKLVRSIWGDIGFAPLLRAALAVSEVFPPQD